MIYLQDYFLRYYDIRPTRFVFLNKILGNSTKILGLIANLLLPLLFKISKLHKRINLSGKNDIVVCFTSFPARINIVWLVIECLLRQSLLPDRIVLYLSSRQFDGFAALPQNLLRYYPHLIDIRFVDDDIRSHKKYWYAITDFPDSNIITIDDDLIYDSHVIEDLVRAYREYPKSIPFCWGTCITYNQDTKIVLPYSKWSIKKDVKLWTSNPSFFFGSGGGTLFPKGSLSGANVSWYELSTICPTADDIWLNAVVRYNRFIPFKIRDNRKVPEWLISRDVKLSDVNNGLKKNDEQLENVRLWFISNKGIDPFSQDFVKRLNI